MYNKNDYENLFFRKKVNPMKKYFRIFAGMFSLCLLFSATACKKNIDQDSIVIQEPDVSPVEPSETTPPEGEEIYWLANYDINPTSNQERSVALTLFEDQFGGKINWIECTADNKFDVLASRILAGDPVDMFPYEWDAMPNGVYKNQYEPLDDYLDLDDPIWDGMRDAIDMYAYNGKHYVVPYAVSDPLLITYSRKMCEENGLSDPYELYQKGKWDWDAFMSMMQKFVQNGSDRYGICGWFGQALMQSTGKTVIGFDGSQFTNNISDSSIESAENLLSQIQKQNLYADGWYNHFPESQNILFYAMADWSLGQSNAVNPDADLMAVPFPKSPYADQYYLSGNYAAKMLVKNSTKGNAVAKYIYCERLAQTEKTYQTAARQKALIPETSASGLTLSYLTDEQYDAIQSYKTDTVTVFDFGYGMGSTMYGEGSYTYETRGVMNNLADAILLYPEQASSWAVLRESFSPVIDEVLTTYNVPVQ